MFIINLNKKNQLKKPFLTSAETTAGVKATRFSFKYDSFGTPIESDLYGAPAIAFLADEVTSTGTSWPTF
jgi:hypothetical protein